MYPIVAGPIEPITSITTFYSSDITKSSKIVVCL